MAHRHITTSSAYQPGDTFISASPATGSDTVIYTLPTSPAEGRRIDFFNVITPDEFTLLIYADGGQIDCASEGGTQSGVILVAGRGITLRWIGGTVNRWAAIAMS